MIRRSLFAALFIVAGLSATQTAYADAAGEALVRDALHDISSEAGWTASAEIVRSEGDEVIVEGLSIADSGSKFRLSVETIALTGLKQQGEGYFATAASVRNLAVDFDLTSTAPTDTADNKETSMASKLAIEMLDIAKLYVPAKVSSGPTQAGIISGYLAFYAYLADVEMASLTAPRMDFEQTISMPDPDQAQTSRTTYHDNRITDWAGGIISRYDLGRLEIRITGGPSGDYTMGADGAWAEHIDLGHNIHVLDPARYVDGRGDLVWKPVMKRAEYSGFRINSTDADVTIARVSLSEIELRQPEKPFLSAVESMIASGLAGEELEGEAVIELLDDFLPGLFNAFRIGEILMEDMQVQPTASSDPVGMSLAEFRIAGLSGEGIDQFRLSGLSGTGPDVNIKLGTFRFDRIGFPKWDAFAATIEMAAKMEKSPDNPEIEADMARRLMDLYPTADLFLMQDLSGNAPGKEPFTVDELRVQVTQRLLGFMVGGNGAIKGMMFPASYFDEGNGPNPLALLNYDRLAAELDFKSVWNETTTDIDYVLNMQVEDVGDLSIGYRFNGFTEESAQRLFEGAFALGAAGEEDIGKIIGLFSEIGFNGFILAFTDRSIIDRALGLAAAQQGSDAQTYRDQLKAALPFFLSAMPPGEFRQQIIDTAQAALDGGRKTTFSLKPAGTVMIPDIIAAGMQDPVSLIDMLGAGMASEAAN